MISCILLSAGESKRFGSPKALAQIHQTTAIELLQTMLLKSIVNEIIVVTGAHDDLIKPHVFNHSKVRIVYNKDYKIGQTSSFQTGISVANPLADGFMLLPVDCPFIQPQTIDQLIEYFNHKQSSILLPIHKGMRGHPPIFHKNLRETILNLNPYQGMNNFMREQIVESLELEDPGIVQTFNTPEELNKLLSSK